MGVATPPFYAMLTAVQTNPMTFLQQHPNYPHFGHTVSFTPTTDGRVLVITDTEYVNMSKEDARIEWRQNAAQGWKRLA